MLSRSIRSILSFGSLPADESRDARIFGSFLGRDVGVLSGDCDNERARVLTPRPVDRRRLLLCGVAV